MPPTDDWPFLYRESAPAAALRRRARADPGGVGRHRGLCVLRASSRGRWSWQFFFLGAGFMLLETKAIIQFALLWGSTWIVASLAIASVLTMALAGDLHRLAREISRPGLVGRAGRPAWSELRHTDRPVDVREPRRRVTLLRGADVQPDPLRRPAVRLGHQAFDVAGCAITARTSSARWSAASPSTCR